MEHGPDDGRQRREPSLGSPGALDQLDFSVRRSKPGKSPRRLSAVWWWGAGCLAAIMLLVVFREPLADRIWPETRAQSLRAQAALALHQGRLTAEDGSGARELYEAALAIEPDRSEARVGLRQVADAALVQAREATMEERFTAAHDALDLAKALSVPRAEAVQVQTELRMREAAHAGIPSLLARAEAAREAGHLVDDPDAALPIYQRVLQLQPDNEMALRGREDVLGDLLQASREQLREGRLAEATVGIAIAREYDAGHVDLPETQARLNEELEDLRRHAIDDLQAGRLESAMGRYQLLAEAGHAPEAAAALDKVALAYVQRGERMADDYRFADAQAALVTARSLSPGLPRLLTAQRHVEHARQAHARMGRRLPAAERAQRVSQLLEQARRAEARGDLLTPPGDSAFDKLRVARSIAPDDPAVQEASSRMQPMARQCFDRELRGNNLADARVCLDAWAIVATDDHPLATARRRLAQRWLAVGDERLAAGEVESAKRALASAREIDPSAPGLDAFATRIRTASASMD